MCMIYSNSVRGGSRPDPCLSSGSNGSLIKARNDGRCEYEEQPSYRNNSFTGRGDMTTVQHKKQCNSYHQTPVGVDTSDRSSKRVYVQHDYHNHYHDPIFQQESIADMSFSLLSDEPKSKLRRGPRGGVAEPFPVKLYEMLSSVDEEGLSHIVSWQPHGRCFTIHKPNEFVKEVMPRYFKQTKLTSFQRQVNLYSFSRLTAGKDRGGYYHELFLRGRPDLCRGMIRRRVKGNGTKAAYSPATEPDFYTMEICLQSGPSKKLLPPPPPVSSSFSATTRREDKIVSVPRQKTEEVITDSSISSISSSSSGSSGSHSFEYGDDDSNSNADIGVVDHNNEHAQQSEQPSEKHLQQENHDLSSLADMVTSIAYNNPRTTVPPPVSNCDFVDEMDLLDGFDSLLATTSSCSSSSSLPQVCSLSSFSAPLSLCTSSKITASSLPHSGDEVLFEGLPFHYLDTLLFDDLDENF